MSFLALFDAGDRLAISSPGYPAYRNILQALDIEPVSIDLKSEDGFAMSAHQLAIEYTKNPFKGVLAMSPSNPSGTMIKPEELNNIAGFCKSHGLWLLSDEIYHGLTYNSPSLTALSYDDDAIILNSFSKYYCMTGWRIGWLVVPEKLVRPLERLAQNLYICPPHLSQIAAIAAFDATEELEKVKQLYAKNRSMLLEELPKLGITKIHPVDGAFYIYADMSDFTNNSTDFCKLILNEAGVALTPGLDFDAKLGAHHIRLSFAGSECVEGIKRIKQWLTNQKPDHQV